MAIIKRFISKIFYMQIIGLQKDVNFRTAEKILKALGVFDEELKKYYHLHNYNKTPNVIFRGLRRNKKIKKIYKKFEQEILSKGLLERIEKYEKETLKYKIQFYEYELSEIFLKLNTEILRFIKLKS